MADSMLIICTGTAVFGAVALGGFLVLLYIKRTLVKRVLLESCRGKGSSLVAGPADGFRTGQGTDSVFRRRNGIVCLTDQELVFVPLLGTGVTRIPAHRIRHCSPPETGQKIWTVRTESDGVFTIQEPRRHH